MSPTARAVQRHYLQAIDLALIEVERLARKILATHPNLTEFVMAMGTATFFDGYEHLALDERAYMKPLRDFFDEWNDVLHLAGTPMRFTATGKKITDW
jgi:hypothetical protein